MKLGMFHLVLSLAAVLPLAVVQVKAADPVDESQAVELFQAMEEGLVEVHHHQIIDPVGSQQGGFLLRVGQKVQPLASS